MVEGFTRSSADTSWGVNKFSSTVTLSFCNYVKQYAHMGHTETVYAYIPIYANCIYRKYKAIAIQRHVEARYYETIFSQQA